FQAEDVIRDFHVTGVQTCALPICFFNFFMVERIGRAVNQPFTVSNHCATPGLQQCCNTRDTILLDSLCFFTSDSPGMIHEFLGRSEERRVGREMMLCLLLCLVCIW